MRVDVLLSFLGVAACCWLVGGFALVIGLRQLRRHRSLEAHGVLVSGIVTDFRLVVNTDFSRTYPVLRFRTMDGQDVETLIQVGRGVTRLKLGQVAPVIYDASNPRHVTVGTSISSASWVGFAIVFVVAAMFLLGGLVFLAVSLIAALAT